ncbi:precorrin-3B synthase [Streptomyces sp. DSM 42041]|uniref:Precorrin-3B synthase n=1 Tax=Streptomyces hazeniae TaxID=3075538 RepID=A0ABU2NW21_9ACTN|nr:precorrin-3B synthase [Streptomyces sp. DSM 42041]MDT0380192.1 precorrin-3B synthase [Streptomyces sp. DSM 42041]
MPTPRGRTSASPAPVTAPVRGRHDACPGALRLHAADDGALARVRVPGGALTAAQAHLLADTADRLGDGALHLTSRGNVQLRGLAAGCGAQLAARLREAGLLPSAAHERVRNVVATPLSGLDARGHADVRPWVRELDRLLCADPGATGLSGRFLFAFDDGRGDVAALGADVTVTAATPAPGADGTADASGTAVVRVGTSGAAVTVPAADAPGAALYAAQTFLALGTGAWRVSDAPDTAAAVTEALRTRFGRPSPVPGAGPATGDGHDAGAPRVRDAAGAGRATPGVHVEGAGPAPGVVVAPGGVHAALCVTAPLGTLTSAQARLLADLALTRGTRVLRVTPWRGVVVPGLASAAAPTALAETGAAGLVTSAASPWFGLGACAGRPGCAASLSDVRADARAAAAGHDSRPPLPVYLSGCTRRCGRPKGPHVDAVATGDSRYEVSVPGTDDAGEFAAALTATAAARTTADG